LLIASDGRGVRRGQDGIGCCSRCRNGSAIDDWRFDVSFAGAIEALSFEDDITREFFKGDLAGVVVKDQDALFLRLSLRSFEVAH